jgi:DNA-binding MarR family transcriptional regulator
MQNEFSDNQILKKFLFNLVKKAKMDMDKRFLACKIGITPFQYAILTVLNTGPSTLNDLAKTLIMQPPSLVPPVDQLEDLGLLKRQDDSQDRRKIQLSITAKGKSLLKQELFDDKDDKLNMAFRSLDPNKQKQLLNLLNELNEKFN